MIKEATVPVELDEDEVVYSVSSYPTIGLLVPAMLLAITSPFAADSSSKYRYSTPEFFQAVEVNHIPTLSAAYEETAAMADVAEKTLTGFLGTLLENSQETPRDIAEAINARFFDLL